MTIYSGTCHCGAVQFEVHADIRELTTCDCSLCRRRNAVMAIVPETALSLRAGQGSLGHYTWNSGLAKHYFCSVCGIYVFHRKRAMQGHFSVNAYCLEGLDVSAKPVRATEGVGMSIVDPNARAEWPGPRD